MDSTGKRLEKLMKALVIDRRDLEQSTGIHSGKIADCINGKLWAKKGIPEEKLLLIKEAYPETNLEYMRNGIGYPLLTDAPIVDSFEQGLPYVDIAALFAMHSFNAAGKTIEDPKHLARRSYDLAEALDEIRIERIKRKL
jgi:hypothetical protein